MQGTNEKLGSNWTTRISAYGSELNQVWTNIIDNTIDAIGERHRNIWLRTKQENNNIVVEISDDGSGIPQDIQSCIFEQFFTTKDIGKGTGLGLSISYRIVAEMHKGDLDLLLDPEILVLKFVYQLTHQ